MSDDLENKDDLIQKVSHRAPWHVRVRTKIKTAQIINRLQKHTDGEVEMTSSQIKAAEILLNKTLPALSEQQLTVMQQEEPQDIAQIRQELMQLLLSDPTAISTLVMASPQALAMIEQQLNKGQSH